MASREPVGAETESVREALGAEGITKRFGPVVALENVSLHVNEGEVLGLIGDNGAGKSTLIKIFTGFHRPDRGRLYVEGKPVTFRSVSQARAHGIETLFQDLALVPGLSVYHNMFLNKEPTIKPLRLLDNRRMRREARAALDDIGVNIPSLDTEVGRLSGGQRQAIAIARAVYSDARILLLDEPLAAMGAKEGAMILDLIRRLKRRGGVSMIVIVHNYSHVFDVCDRVNLLQHGTITFDRAVSDTSLEELNELVVEEYRRALKSVQEEDQASR